MKSTLYIIGYFVFTLFVGISFTFFSHEASTEFEAIFAYIAFIGYAAFIAPIIAAIYLAFKHRKPKQPKFVVLSNGMFLNLDSILAIDIRDNTAYVRLNKPDGYGFMNITIDDAQKIKNLIAC